MGGDAIASGMFAYSCPFQSTPPHGRRLGLCRGGAEAPAVSIHASAWEATGGVRLPGPARRFQSTPPHGRRPQYRKQSGRFNPRLRMGGDDHAGTAVLLRHCFNTQCKPGRFNPRLRMGGDDHGTAVLLRHCFNPRLRMGGDSSLMRRPCCSVVQSTPPREATGQWALHSFNPRLRMGGDRRRRPSGEHSIRFQSTPPHGRRQLPASGARASESFNPRLRMGGDPRYAERRQIDVFQSTPPHGRRRARRQAFPAISIHASAWEATRGLLRCRQPYRVSIHASGEATSDFNPRLRMGGDTGSPLKLPRADVSIHASAWEATAGGTDPVFQSTPPHGRRPGGR